MKILHINSYYAKSSFYKDLFDIQNRSLDISVYVPVSNDFSDLNFDYGKYTVISKNHSKFDRIIFNIKHKKIFSDIQKVYNDIGSFDLTHAHSLFSNGFIAYKLKQKYNIPYIAAVRNTDINTFFKYMPHLRNLGLKILLNAKKVIFLSDAYKNTLFSRYIPAKYALEIENKSMIIPNGINSFWHENRINAKKQLSSPKNVSIVYAGKINKTKNLLGVQRASNILINKGFKVKYTVAGKIENNRIFNKLSESSFFEHIDHCSKEELIKIFRKCDIFAMPSYAETFGLVYAEALTQGLPVIYSRDQGFDTQFEDGTVGFAVNPNSEQDIADKIISICENYSSISENCIEKSQKFNWNEIAEIYIKVYEER